MHWIKELKRKNWIDWIKILVALDISSAGVGLILNLHLHIIAPILGFITRILMGIFYIMLAVIILKKVFPKSVDIDEEELLKSEHIHDEIQNKVKESKRFTRKVIYKLETISNNIINKIDALLDKVEDFFHKKKKEIKEEVHNTLHKD